MGAFSINWGLEVYRIIKIYTTGEIFSLQEWHDSYIWDHVRLEFEDKKGNNKKMLPTKSTIALYNLDEFL